jgi:uncharacterized cofD-like protein
MSGDLHNPGIKAVVVGGGTGAPVSIRALLSLGFETSAVVAMADDGGSSGLLRGHTGRVPPGDVRKCLTAMAADDDAPWVKAFAQRFDFLNNHTLGNLILTALEGSAGSFQAAIELCERLLETRGHVYPSTLASVVLSGTTRDGRRLSGQKSICASHTALARVSLTPHDPDAYGPAVEALREADLIVLGPGSLFTSIIPNLLVPGILRAIYDSKALVVYVCNLGDMQGETWGLDAAELVEALLAHGLRGMLDVVIVHRDADAKSAGRMTGMFKAVDPATAAAITGAHKPLEPSIRRVAFDTGIGARINEMGPVLVSKDLADPLRPTWHSVEALAEALEGVVRACRSRRR